MTASEKLRALYDRADPVAVSLLDDALPLIADVVEAAEAIGAMNDEPIWGTSDGLGFRLTDTLAALDEHLGLMHPNGLKVIGNQGPWGPPGQ